MPTTGHPPSAPTQRQFTVDEYYRMGEAGVFGDDDRVALIDGHVYTMTPIGSEHAACVRRLTRLFVRTAEPQALVSTINPIRLDEISEPEPDLALLVPRDDDFAAQHPGPDDVFLVVEVADTSLAFDREMKLPLYAATGIPEVCITDLASDTVHVYREPHSGTYTTHETYGTENELSVAALPDPPRTRCGHSGRGVTGCP